MRMGGEGGCFDQRKKGRGRRQRGRRWRRKELRWQRTLWMCERSQHCQRVEWGHGVVRDAGGGGI